MAGSVNKVILIGNLGADPEIRRTQDGRPIANLRIATSESWRDKATGERKEKTEWHRVVIFSEGLCQDRRAVSEEGLEGLPRGPAADPQIQRQGRRREILDRSGAAELQLDAHHAGHAAAAVAAAACPTPTTASARRARPPARKPAMAGAGGKRGDMDDEIPVF